MSLNRAQMEFIELVISDFLPSSVTPEQLIQEIAYLKEALSTPVTASHPFYILRECIVNPCERLQGLESQQQGEPVTVGKVQAFILTFVTNHLKKLAVDAAIDFEKLDWNLDNLLNQFISLENSEKPFASEARHDEPESPWVVTQEPGAIYTYSLRISLIPAEFHPQPAIPVEPPPLPEPPAVFVPEPALMAPQAEGEENAISDAVQSSDEEFSFDGGVQMFFGEVMVTTHLTPEQTSIDTIFLTSASEGDDDESEDIALGILKTQAAIEARRTAAACALKYLLNIKLIQLNTLVDFNLIKDNEFLFSPYEFQIITNKFYFELLKNQKLFLSDFFSIKREVAEVLTNPAIIHLQQKNIINFRLATIFSKDTLKVITHPIYLDLLIQNKIAISELSQLTHEQSAMLTHPTIANLIKQDKLALHIAKMLNIHTKFIFSNGAYITYFNNHAIDWSIFLKLTESQCKVLLNKTFIKFITNDLLIFSDIATIPEGATSLLLVYPQLANWLCHGIFSLSELVRPINSNITQLYALAFAKRLESIRMRRPHTINDKVDNIDDLIQEITNVATEAKLLPTSLLDKIFVYLMKIIKEDIKIRASFFPNFGLLLTIIVNVEDSPFPDWRATFQALIANAEEITSSQTTSIFRPAKRRRLNTFSEDMSVRDFCYDLLSLKPLQVFCTPFLIETPEIKHSS